VPRSGPWICVRFLTNKMNSDTLKKQREKTFFELFEKMSRLDLTILKHDNKPDFVISHQMKTVGLEVTDGGSEEFNRAFVNGFAGKSTGMSVHNLSDGRKATRRSNEELERQVAETKFVESEPEVIRWASGMRDGIATKIQLIERGGLKLFHITGCSCSTHRMKVTT